MQTTYQLISLHRKRGHSPMDPISLRHSWKRTADKLAKEASKLQPPCHPMPLRNAKRLFRDKLRQKRISTLTDLAVGKTWSCLLDGQRRAQLSALSRVEGVACFRIITGHDYLQAHLFKIGLADSPLCSHCNSVPMTGEHLSDCPALLHVLS
ncbi:putative non-ltr rnase hi domain of reverse transcriptase [Trichonephila clavipes]|nr:putative non-ltr rnase hi domain of reverse transcriptase [Trichonephila clavipes]